MTVLKCTSAIFMALPSTEEGKIIAILHAAGPCGGNRALECLGENPAAVFPQDVVDCRMGTAMVSNGVVSVVWDGDDASTAPSLYPFTEYNGG